MGSRFIARDEVTALTVLTVLQLICFVNTFLSVHHSFPFFPDDFQFHNDFNIAL